MPTDAGIFAVYPHRRYLPAKVRVFVDFLVQWFRDERAP
ncbi:MAG: LysR family transcriptional regulator, partial [Nitratireductor sp.]